MEYLGNVFRLNEVIMTKFDGLVLSISIIIILGFLLILLYSKYEVDKKQKDFETRIQYLERVLGNEAYPKK